MQSENYHDWERFKGNKIPSSVELFPIIWDYLSTDFKILDVGCGFGKTCIELAAHGYRCTGIDINETGVEWARVQAEQLNLAVLPEFVVMDALDTTFGDAYFDLQIWQALLTTIIGIDNRRKLFRGQSGSTGTINALYHAKTERVEFATLEALCEVLDCGVRDILEYKPKKV